MLSCRATSVFLASLSVSMLKVQSQSSSQDSFIIQYLERRLLQVEERLSLCEQNTASVTQKNYDLSSELRGYMSTLGVVKSELKNQADGLAVRLERLERELEYLENQLPDQADIQMEEALLEQQVKAAELEQQRRRASIRLDHDCHTALSQIKSLKIVKKSGDAHGSWFKDPSPGSNKVYLLSGVRNDTVLEFDSLQGLVEEPAGPGAKLLQLPTRWQGSGQVVHSGFLYYHKADTPNQILKVELLNRTVVDSTLVPGAGRLPAYSLNPDTFLDLKVDELGLWAVHADPEYGGNLVVTKLDRGTLSVEFSWDTQCRSRDAEGAFLICGTLYVVYNTRYGGRSTVQCVYDIHDSIHSVDSPVLFFPKRYSSHSSFQYHPGGQELYAWDDGYQTVYRVETHRDRGQAGSAH